MKRKTSIIVVTYNNLDFTKQCLKSIRKYSPKDSYELIVIDNNSKDKTKEYLQKQNDLKLILNDDNKGFPRACNQGIKIANKKNDILFLNNDTIVTSNWLLNLQKCLYSSKKIGAVGAVCNKDENRQGIDFKYDDLKTMQKLAKLNNISDSSKWEEKTFLIGFCLLVKREVINKLKCLDEKYSPGYIEDNDFCLRILKAGYKLKLCHDVFIHHNLGTSFRKDLTYFYKILFKNRDYFYEKWHFNTFTFDDGKEASFPLLEDDKKVLDLNSGIGVNALSLRYHFKKMEIEGIEEDKYKRKFSKKFIVTYKNLTQAKKNYYDYILIGNYLEKVKNIDAFLKEVKKHLKKDGFLIGEFSNVASIQNINKLLQGENIYQKRNNFSPKSLQESLQKEFVVTYYFKWYQKLNEDEKMLYDKVKDKGLYLDYTYYTFKAKPVKDIK